MSKKAFIIFLTTAVLLSCKTKHTEEQVDWPEMDAYHMAMAECFHPYKDSGNLEPAKLHAAELAGLAEKWYLAPLPENVNNETVKDQLAMLTNKSKQLSNLVKANSDSTRLAQCLDSLHVLFHHVEEGWYRSSNKSEGEGHGEHEHHDEH